MSPTLILGFVAVYFTALLGIAWLTGRNADNQGYFLGNRRSPWPVVAFGLIGDSLSGVSFISVPGKVSTQQFAYFQVVLGYVVGYIVIIHALLPLYYRLRLTSIYGYLGTRFDQVTQKTGSALFLLSRLFGSAARLYLAVTVFQTFVFDRIQLPGFAHPGVPFWLTATAVIALILIYTLRGGIKTLVWTDTFQSAFLVLGVVLTVVFIAKAMGWGPAQLAQEVWNSPLSKVLVWDWRSPSFFWKQFLSGAGFAIVMTGLDQNSMQKNLSCRSLRDAQKNLYAFSGVMMAVNLSILVLGALLTLYSQAQAIALPARTDQLFPLLALQHLQLAAGITFVVGLTAATFNSADSVLTTLTTSFCVDFLRFGASDGRNEEAAGRIRRRVHLAFAAALLGVMLLLPLVPVQYAVIDLVLKVAGYTYGPLLGLFALGVFTRIPAGGWTVPVIAIASSTLCAVLERSAKTWLHGYEVGFETLLLNAVFTAVGVAILARKSAASCAGSQ
jgi:Na+/proline symporter